MRGHKYQTINGKREFYDAIKNQLTTSLSTFDAAIAGREQLISYQQSFYKEVSKLTKQDKTKGFVISEGNDKARFNLFLSLLKQHQIKAYQLTNNVSVRGRSFTANKSVFVPLKQPQYRLIKGIFLSQTNFKDNTFYDVSGWNLAHAFNLAFSEVTSLRSVKYQDKPWQLETEKPNKSLNTNYAYAFEWTDYFAPQLLSQLQQQGIKTRVAMKSFTAVTAGGEYQFEPGSIVIAQSLQKVDNWLQKLQRITAKSNVKVHQIASGLTTKGIDLGSRNMMPLKAPKVLLVGGANTNQYEVGEVWYYLDRYLDLATTMVELERLPDVDLSSYTHIIMAQGRYANVTTQLTDKLKSWVQAGGVIWGHKSAGKFLADRGMLQVDYVSSSQMAKAFSTEHLSYADKDKHRGEKRIAGAIFNTDIDLTHPLSFSFNEADLPVFKNSTFILKPSEKPFVNVIKYSKEPLLAGFSHEKNNQQIAGAGVLVAHNFGKGKVIAMADNPVFRNYWYGTSRLLSNAIFFGHTIDSN